MQGELALLAGVSKTTVGLYERNASGMSVEKLMRLLEALDVDPLEFFGVPPAKVERDLDVIECLRTRVGIAWERQVGVGRR